MPSVKTIKVCTQLSVVNGLGVISSPVPDFEETSIKCKPNLTTKTIEEFYVECQPGECVVYINSVEDFYFDVNSSGELVVICPGNYDFEMNDSGELLMMKE